jgi:hypothetical protein
MWQLRAERVRRLQACVAALLRETEWNGMSRNMRLCQSVERFDFDPICDIFARILTTSREQFASHLLKECSRLECEIAQITESNSQQGLSGECADSSLRELHAKLHRKARRIKCKVQSADDAWHEELALAAKDVSTACHLNARLHKLFNRFESQLGDLKSTLSGQTSALPVILNRYRDRAIEAGRTFHTRSVKSAHLILLETIERTGEREAQAKRANENLQSAMSDLLLHLFPQNPPDSLTPESLRQRIAAARRQGILRTHSALMYPRHADVANTTLQILESELAKVDARYSKVVRQVADRQTLIKIELRSIGDRLLSRSALSPE